MKSNGVEKDAGICAQPCLQDQSTGWEPPPFLGHFLVFSIMNASFFLLRTVIPGVAVVSQPPDQSNVSIRLASVLLTLKWMSHPASWVGHVPPSILENVQVRGSVVGAGACLPT